jgi:hypothetical protein
LTLILVLDGVDYGKDTPSKEAPPLDLTEHLLDAVPDGLLTLLLAKPGTGTRRYLEAELAEYVRRGHRYLGLVVAPGESGKLDVAAAEAAETPEYV